jgi:hypothetical protein
MIAGLAQGPRAVAALRHRWTLRVVITIHQFVYAVASVLRRTLSERSVLFRVVFILRAATLRARRRAVLI